VIRVSWSSNAGPSRGEIVASKRPHAASMAAVRTPVHYIADVLPDARNIFERGYAVFEDVLDPDETRALREGIVELLGEINPPKYYAAQTEMISANVAITSTGLAISRLLDDRPALRPLVLREPVIEAMRDILGDGTRLELAGAVVSDEERPFFRWHTHIDGEEEGERYRARSWPAVERVERVLTLLYLDDIDDRSGPLYVLPRRAGDPTPPPFDLDLERWPGMVELRPRAGTLVALEQCTWHAARSLRGPGLRILAGCYWAAPFAARPAWTDEALAHASLL